jgi:hypothetical protein
MIIRLSYIIKILIMGKKLILIGTILLLLHLPGLAGPGNTDWMSKGKYGIFMHYQYRIMLGYCQINTTLTAHPGEQYPPASAMTSEGWNQFIDGFDVKGFAAQMTSAKVGWVLFCINDGSFAFHCAPNHAFDSITGYKPGEKCSKRDLIMDLANALNPKGIKLIVYMSGMYGYPRDERSALGFGDDPQYRKAPTLSSRKKHLLVLKEYADRYCSKIAGWWFDGVISGGYAENDGYGHEKLASIIHKANPLSVIAFNFSDKVFGCLFTGVDDYTSGDQWSPAPLNLDNLTPKTQPVTGDILWCGKIYCGNIYHGLGNANRYTDDALIKWIRTCNQEGGVCTLDWPFDPKTGLIKDFGKKQMIKIGKAVK